MGNLDIAKILLENDADPNIEGASGARFDGG
jgi:hypothetical protein